jgi:hypothetical protein
MADFATWAQPTLAKLAADQQAEADRLRAIIADLAKEYEVMADMFCKVPMKNEAYQKAKSAIGE